MRFRVPAAAVLGATLFVSSSASAEDSRAAVEGIIKDYLEAHPEEVGELVKGYFIRHPEAVGQILSEILKRRQSAASGAAAKAAPDHHPTEARRSPAPLSTADSQPEPGTDRDHRLRKLRLGVDQLGEFDEFVRVRLDVVDGQNAPGREGPH